MHTESVPLLTDEITLESHGNDRGNLYVGEVDKQIPFTIKRFYVFTNIPPGATRGAHAHKRTEQAVFCLHGSFDLLTDDGVTKETQHIDKVPRGVLIQKKIWHTMSNFSSDCIAIVVASEPYDEADYIRDYQEFLNHIR